MNVIMTILCFVFAVIAGYSSAAARSNATKDAYKSLVELRGKEITLLKESAKRSTDINKTQAKLIDGLEKEIVIMKEVKALHEEKIAILEDTVGQYMRIGQ